MRQKSTLGRLLLLSCLCATLAGCGGKPKRPAKSDAPEEEHTAKIEIAETAPKPTGPDCSDGSCLRCGDAVCPKGFFCDESSSKPACQWVPSCSESVSCSCVKQALSDSCSCSERDGGVYVKCGQ